MVWIDGDCRGFHKTPQQVFEFVAVRVGKRQKTIPFQCRGHSRSSVELSCESLDGHNNRHTNRGDQIPKSGIYMPTTILQKTSSGAPRTFKSLGASCYSGVPCFRPKPGPDSQNQLDTVF